ncbi:AAA family ATPase [Trinickia caryophylli]|uniref:AAA ATPase domain-containing protein n=1 Tax=Trinickia caryophylli TaxID=28094 RepID=A0A1X7FIC5_TRICW|nr:helix-turn-helix domain-containing protein [Trinickia caryophylli]WQE13444.1 AAA family ATPase [Trinickia caryophylli]GLU34032.1 hypothetical protein Busp01_38740 [Trinickia caryophylli]SMF52738.1 AAA ATPase domain-containing protein [Trinickia caryophylli]
MLASDLTDFAGRDRARVPPAHTHDAAADGRVVLDPRLLKGLRKKLGISQETLAERCFHKQLCVSIASIKRAETGKPVLYRTARHLADVFEVEISTLVTETDPMPAEQAASGAPPGQAGTDRANTADAYFDTHDDVIRYVLELGFEWHPHTAASGAAQQELRQLIAQFGGVLESSPAGAGLYALARFGMPRAYRSDVERCLACASAIAAEHAAYLRPDSAIRVRLSRWPPGTPQAADAHDDGLFPSSGHPYGHVPIHVAQGLVAQLTDRFEFLPATAAEAGYRRYLRMRVPGNGPQSALIGRTVELLQFKGIVDATLECQSGHVLYLRGAAGVGKSRLTDEFADMAREAQFACHRAEVLDFGMESTLAPLSQLVHSLLGLPRRLLPGAPSAAVQPAIDRWQLPAQSNFFLRMLAGEPPDEAAMATYAAMSHDARTSAMLHALQLLLMRLSLQQPLLVCIEDLHWGEPPLFRALRKLLADTNEMPIVWVLTSRGEDDPLETALRPHIANPLSVLELAPLRVREAAALAERYADVSPAHRAGCIARAQGNPLYLTQLLSNPDESLPNSLKHLVQARIDKLGPAHRQALSVAAVIGNRFELSLLNRALGQPEHLPLHADYRSLIREIDADQCAFVHDLVMHCIYDAIPLSQRDRLHRAVAELVRESNPALHARHLVRGHDPAAFDRLLELMRVNLCAYRYDDVLELAQLCESFPARAAASFSLAMLCAQACVGVGQTASARKHFERAMTLAEQPADSIEAALGLAAVLNMLDCLAEETALLEATRPIALSQHAHRALARLSLLRGNLHFPRGNYLACRNEHEAALRFARVSSDPEIEASALSGIADSYYAQGLMQTAHDVFDQCVRLSQKRNLPGIDAANRSARGSTLIYLGRPTEALLDAFDSVQRSRTIRNRRAEIFARLTAAWVLVAAGEHARADEELDLALDLARGIGASRFEALLLEGKARVASGLGDEGRAQALIVAAADLVERQQLENYIGPWIWGTLAAITADAQTRERALQRGEAQLMRGCLAHNALRFYVTAAETTLVTGDYERADRYARLLSACAQAEPCRWISHHVTLILRSSNRLQVRDEANEKALRAVERESAQLGFSSTMPKLMRMFAGG